MKCAVPGYLEAVAEECRLRDLAYLDIPETLCGVPVNVLTPRLWTVLRAIQTPFLRGGPISDAHVAQFIWALSLDYERPREWVKRFPWSKRPLTGPERVSRAVVEYTLDECVAEIDGYLKRMFMDAPTGGKESKPIASGEAWLIFRFEQPPFSRNRDVIRNTPLPQLYQELRCHMSDQGASISNQSDMKNIEFAQSLTDALARGEITLEQIDAMNYRSMYGTE